MTGTIDFEIHKLSYEYDAIDREISELKMKLVIRQERRDAVTEKLKPLMAQRDIRDATPATQPMSGKGKLEGVDVAFSAGELIALMVLCIALGFGFGYIVGQA